MKCPQCGFENRPNARFCKKCGHNLQAEEEPLVRSQTSNSTVCPFCGGTIKPNARFCPRCGEKLSDEAFTSPTAAQPQPSASAPQPSADQPAGGYAQPPHQPPPPSDEPQPAEDSLPRWLIWAGGALAFLCIIGLVVGGIKFGPGFFGSQEEPTPPTATPTSSPQPSGTITPTTTPTITPTTPSPTSKPQISLVVSSNTIQRGNQITVTITVTNTNAITLSNLRYQLIGEWGDYLELTTDEMVKSEGKLAPQTSQSGTFQLQARDVGKAIAILQGYVLMDKPTDEVVGDVSNVETISIKQ